MKPVDGSIVPMVVLLLVHVPPGVALLSVVVVFAHKVGVPVIAVTRLTETVVVVEQPPGIV